MSRTNVPAGREIAIATGRSWLEPPDDERPLLAELARRSFLCVPAAWDDPAADWARFACVVIRSCWDYHLRLAEFESFLDRLERAGRPVLNPVPLVRWNARKSYLLELRDRGVRVPASRVIARGSGEEAPFDGMGGADSVVVKPLVSASARETHLVTRDGVPGFLPAWRRLVAAGDVLVQEFVPEVRTRGEWSLVFFDGVPSHAVLKRPASGDFRVQSEHGGSVAPGEPAAAVRAAAERALRATPPGAAFARVDVVEADEPVLMEVELIEPQLFLKARPGSERAFADAIERRLEAAGG